MPTYVTPEIAEVVSQGRDQFIREAVIAKQGKEYWLQMRWCIIARLLRAGKLKAGVIYHQPKVAENHHARRIKRRAEERAIAFGIEILEHPPIELETTRFGRRARRRRRRHRKA